MFSTRFLQGLREDCVLIKDTAKSLIEDDTYYTMSLLRKGASHAYAPRSLVCCICNSILAKNSTDYTIQVFSCGHALHLGCQLEENIDSCSGVGCPICIPRKKGQRSSEKSKNGLVNSSLAWMQQHVVHQLHILMIMKVQINRIYLQGLSSCIILGI